MRSFIKYAAPLLLTVVNLASSTPQLVSRSRSLVSSAGDLASIPGWHMISENDASDDLKDLSMPGKDVSSWHRIGSHATVMAGLIEGEVYDEETIYFSDNLKTMIDYPSMKDVSYLYREEFNLKPKKAQRFSIHTHGITSRADIFVNGELVVSNDVQVGSYGGQKYDITEYVHRKANCILIKAYPTEYLKDLAIGFVDWNPYPADNGTGIWRDVEISQTGPVMISTPRVVTDFKKPGSGSVTVTVKTDVKNLEDKAVKGEIDGHVENEDGGNKLPVSESFSLGPNEEKTVSLKVTIDEPKIWWPTLWGEQPLYVASISASTSGELSDGPKARNFGIKDVTSEVNSHDTIEFKVNGQPFFVKGAGYTADLFLRFDAARTRIQFQLMLDMGLNTVRLEGKQEQTELFDLADKMGLMVMAGWECCNKWEAWDYNNEAPGIEYWEDEDYMTANMSMLHEAEFMQTHPSMLAFLVGSDFWTDDRATKIYVDALERMDWTNPIVSSAAKRGYPELLGPSGMKMEGPYDWVPPNYWSDDKLGAAAAGGFGSELGAGVGTPEMGSLKKFMSEEDLEDLWTKPDKGQYHMAKGSSPFSTRSIYNEGLFSRYGEPKSLEDYLLKTQIQDFEATRSEFEGYAAHQSDDNPSTGLIYWMLNGAWPKLHWSLFDHYLKPMGSYFGTKVGSRTEHVAYNYKDEDLYIINHSLDKSGPRTISVDLIDINGKELSQDKIEAETAPVSSKKLSKVPGIDKIKDVAFLRLILQDPDSDTNALSRNVYWLSHKQDIMDWDNSTWYHTPVTEYADFSALNDLETASVKADVEVGDGGKAQVTLENESDVPAFFIRMNLLDNAGEEVAPVFWSDNYVTLWPKEKLSFEVEYEAEGVSVEISGFNVEKVSI